MNTKHPQHNKWELHNYSINSYCYYNSPFTNEQLSDIISIGEKEELQDATIGDVTNTRTNLSFRKTKISWIFPDDNNQWIFRKLTDVILDANKQYFNYDLNSIEALQYSYYTDNAFYEKHLDHAHYGAGQQMRKLSFTLQLTDPSEYEGGQTLLWGGTEPFVVPQELGMLTFFPSFLLHEVTPVTKGVRKALVGWVLGPLWK